MKNSKLVMGIFTFLFFIIIASINPASAQAASANYRTLFDAEYYYKTYSDVAAAYGMNDSALYSHFVNYGIYEGRSGNAEFDVNAYRTRYSDLEEAFGDNLVFYYNHYISYGRAEGRIATASGQPYTGTLKKNTASANTTSKTEQTKTAQSDMQTLLKNIVARNREKKAKKETVLKETQNAGTENTAPEGDNNTNGKQQEDASNVSAKTTKETATKSAPQKISVSGTYTSYYDESEARATNVKLAAQRINGTVVQPGETFSFSETVLPRTAENGYVVAPVILGGKMSEGLGGGICQVSSTLYAAMITAEIPATERYAHSLYMDYVPKGMDATIAGNTKDLKFENIYEKPLVITASAVNGKLVVSIAIQE